MDLPQVSNEKNHEVFVKGKPGSGSSFIHDGGFRARIRLKEKEDHGIINDENVSDRIIYQEAFKGYEQVG